MQSFNSEGKPPPFSAMYPPPEFLNCKLNVFDYFNKVDPSQFNFQFPPPTTSNGQVAPPPPREMGQDQASTSQAMQNNQIACQQQPASNPTAPSSATTSTQQQQVSPTIVNFDFHPNDFGHVVKLGAENLSEADKYRFLTNFYTPPNPPHHEWPAEVRSFKGKTVVRRLNPSTLNRHDCATMAYSPMYGGLFCRNCAVFPPSKPQISKSLFIKKPFVRFSHMFGNGGAVKKHVLRKYHLEATAQAQLFVQRMKDPDAFMKSEAAAGGGDASAAAAAQQQMNPNALLGQMIDNNLGGAGGGGRPVTTPAPKKSHHRSGGNNVNNNNQSANGNNNSNNAGNNDISFKSN